MFIIDGHNLLHSLHKICEEPESVSDIQLCRIVNRFLRLTREKAQIVFDGPGPRDKSAFDNISNLEVLFAGRASDADTVIEDQIRANTAPRRLTVVSSDRRLRAAGRARRAKVVKSDVFWNDLQKQLSRKTKGHREPNGKRWGLSESETDEWLKFFGLEQ